MARSKPKYSGVLATPIRHIPRKPSVTLAEMAEWDKAKLASSLLADERRVAAEYANEAMKKLPALYLHYGIADGDSDRLVIALALDHVPGFAMAKAPPGARAKWNPWNVAALRLHIELTQQEKPKRTFAKAAALVAESKIWAPLLRRRGINAGETLRRRALTANDRVVEVLRDAFQYKVEFASPERPPTIGEFVRKWVLSD